MRKSPRELLDSLSIRLLVPIFVTVGLVLAAWGFVSLRSTQAHFGELVRTDAHRYSDLIRRATHDGMLLNRKGDVQLVLERLADGPGVAGLRVYDMQGRVALAGRPGQIGDAVPPSSIQCAGCHRDEGRPPSSLVLAGAPFGGSDTALEGLRHLSVIPNEPDCAAAGCHPRPSQQPVLGVLDVEMSLDPLAAAQRSSRRQTVLATISLMLVIGLVAAVVIDRTVLQPVGQLREGTQRIAGGDLDTRIVVPGRHELSQLARAFNRMAADLAVARHESGQWSQRLEEKVIEKTEELRKAQRHVLHMEKMASLGKLSATVAHELNNPLNGILTYARLVDRELDDQPLDPEVREELGRYLKLMQQECSRCGSIVQNLLLFARRTGAEMAPVDVVEIAERSLMLVKHHLEMRSIRLDADLDLHDRQIVADSGQLQQAFIALLVNAVEAMTEPDDEGGELTVALDGDREEVRISIADTGVGIPPEVQPLIFEPFFSTKDKESGVGLGLAVVYGIVRRHGGSIEVESEPGRGTVFLVRLPRTPPPDEGRDERSTA